MLLRTLPTKTLFPEFPPMLAACNAFRIAVGKLALCTCDSLDSLDEVLDSSVNIVILEESRENVLVIDRFQFVFESLAALDLLDKFFNSFHKETPFRPYGQFFANERVYCYLIGL